MTCTTQKIQVKKCHVPTKKNWDHRTAGIQSWSTWKSEKNQMIRAWSVLLSSTQRLYSKQYLKNLQGTIFKHGCCSSQAYTTQLPPAITLSQLPSVSSVEKMAISFLKLFTGSYKVECMEQNLEYWWNCKLCLPVHLRSILSVLCHGSLAGVTPKMFSIFHPWKSCLYKHQKEPPGTVTGL